MPIQFVGPSYTLRNRKGDVQRSVNLFPSVIESGSGKGAAQLMQAPGLKSFCPIDAPIRGAIEAKGRCFVVAGIYFFEIFRDGTRLAIGTLQTETGYVDMAAGLDQVVLVDGPYGYVYRYQSNDLTNITSENFYGANQVVYLDTYFVFNRTATRQIYKSAPEDGLTFDALDFASAESTPDNLLGLIADHRQILLLKPYNIEIWDVSSGTFYFARNNSAVIEVGVMSSFTAKSVDNSVFWLGSDKHGSGMVWRLNGYTPVRVSNHALEEAIQEAVRAGYDMSQARAYTYQMDGHSFYVLQVPGLATTWVFDAATNVWHERAELIDGEYAPHRARQHVYVYGKHLVGGDNGVLYEMDPLVNNNDGDILVRDRISPHVAVPTLDWGYFNSFQLDCEVGHGKLDGQPAQLMMRYSDDGGRSWKNWRTVSLGAVGQTQQRAIFRRLGRARDRVWHVRVTDDTAIAMVGANIE